MKKVLLVLLGVALLSPLAVIAADPGGIPTGLDFMDALGFISMGAGAIAIALGVGFLILGVFKFATAAGDPKVVEEAKVNLVWAAIAVAIGAVLWSKILLNWLGL